jgi:hypothetical protein
VGRQLTGLLAGLLLALPGSATAAVVINELLYHPAGLPEAEFLELYNTGPGSVDLDGWCIEGLGICFGPADTIAAGGFLVLARDSAVFLATYGFPADLEYSGALGNGGETLVLRDASLAVVDQLTYSDVAPWPVTPDGLGPSLELIDASLDNDDPRNWRASTAGPGHSAGAANSVAGIGLPPWITSVQHTVADPAADVTVTALVEDAVSVDLVYRIDFGPEVAIPMFDDGAHGDGAAGDLVHGAVIPGQPIDALIRYRIEATSCGAPVVVLDEGFDADAGSFAYQDDTFRGTAAPADADGFWDATGGASGGGLHVVLGPGPNGSLPISGGFEAPFSVTGPSSVDVQLTYRLIQATSYEPDEISEALLAIDGGLIGSPPDDSLVQLAGGGDSGFATEVFTLPLADGAHTITLGGYNNKSTASGEITDVFFDDVQISASPCPTGGDMSSPRSDDTIDYHGTVVLDPTLASDLPILHWYIDPNDFAAALAHKLTDETEPAVLFYDGVLYDNVQVRVRGQSSRSWPKNHWKFIFPQGHPFSAPGLIANSVDNFNLQGNYGDKSHLREILAHETFGNVGLPGLETFHVRVEQNGGFFGLYTYLEQPDADWLERVGLSPDAARYKAFGDCRKQTLSELQADYEKVGRVLEDYSDLEAFLSGLADLTGPARRDFIFDNVDLPAQINYMAATILIHNNDHPAKNYYLYRDTEGTGRWTMHQWDLDLTFGRNFDGAVLNDQIWADVDAIAGRTNVSPSHPLFGDQLHQKYDFIWNRCIDAYLAEPEVREMFFRRLRTLMDALLAAPDYEARIDALTPAIDGGSAGDEFELDWTKWGQYGASQTLATAVSLLKNAYLAVRRTHLFTTHADPGDPDDIPEPQSGAPAIVIHEIMYNPIGGATHEFVELYNPSASEAVDLSGWMLEGTGLSLPPGTVILPESYLILARDDTAFRAQYGGGHFVPGQYPNNLDNAGASLVLRDALGIEIDRVDYGDSAPWPATPDGGGPSLELIDPALDNNDPANWAASLTAGGSPGGSNSVSIPGGPPPALRVNEVVPLNASIVQDEQGDFDGWIEIYNASPSSVDLAGMFLSESADPNDPKWTFPAATPICAGCFLLVWADDEAGEGPLHASFTLAPGGGSVHLYRSDLLEIDALTYPALAMDVAYGRFPDGGFGLEELYVATPGAANQTAPVPVILNEYNAVSSSNLLAPPGSDTFWGSVPGNGGDWFELVVTLDHVDLRGWDLVITNETGSPTETTDVLTLSADPIWSDLRAGTIITVSEQLASDVSYAPDLVTQDFWINVEASNGAPGTYITASNFPVSNDDWQLTVRDASDQVVFGPAGEGVNPTGGVGSDEVFKLEEDPSQTIHPFSDYNDGTSSTFGSPNVYAGGTAVQDFTALRFPDGDGDGYPDVVETNTGTFVSPLDTGTDPNDPDTDGDGLLDGVETHTQTFVDANDTGSDPHLVDSDGDGVGDGDEVAAGSDPNDPLSKPPPVPGPGVLGMLLGGLALLLTQRWVGIARTRP